MDNNELLQAISLMMDEKLKPINERLTNLEDNVGNLGKSVSALEKNVEVIKENVQINRHSLNLLLNWAEKTDNVVNIGLYEQGE